MLAPVETTCFTLCFGLLTVVTAVASPENQIHLLMPHSGSGVQKDSDINCLSWRLALETNNLQNWYQIPETCRDYIADYMLGNQYGDDCDFVAGEAYKYARGLIRLNLTGDGKDIWVFDVDDTALSNVPFYAGDSFAFGAVAYNATAFNEWVAEGTAPAIPAVLKLYKRLVRMGFKVVFLTGTHDTYLDSRIKNLKAVGYTTWEKLILKGAKDGGAVVFKSGKRKELEEAGYRIRGNVGDQWSDLTGCNIGDRTFKIPDPMYFVA